MHSGLPTRPAGPVLLKVGEGKEGRWTPHTVIVFKDRLLELASSLQEIQRLEEQNEKSLMCGKD